MTLSYDAELEDFLEVATRHYFRTSSARDIRIRSTVFGALIMGAAICYAARRSEPMWIAIATLAGAAAGAALNYFTYRGSAKKRLRKHLAKELKGRLPARTVYSFEPGHLKCTSLGASITFALSDLESLAVDEAYLEMNFGKIGTSMVPLRAFSSTEEREAFIQMLKSEKDRPEASAPSATPPAEAAS